jgi:hypothetical protein
MVNDSRIIGIIGTKQYHSITNFRKTVGGDFDPKTLSPPTDYGMLNFGGITCWNAAETAGGSALKPYCVYCGDGGCLAHSNPGAANEFVTRFRSFGGTNTNLPFKDQFWDVQSFEKKEFFFTVSSMVTGHFGLTRWSLGLKEEKNHCWLESKTPANKLYIPSHTSPEKGYDLATVNWDFILMLSVYEHATANLWMVDASTMG